MATGSTLSVVIPSWGEGELLVAAVAHAREVLAPCEVVVAAAGESDAIRSRVERLGALWVDAPRPCRGLQLRLGAERARGDVLVFLHVDSRLPPPARPAILAAVAGRRAAGGAFRLRFDRAHPALDLLAWLSRLSLAPAFLGDQCQFATRAAYDACGGFRDDPLFEDVDFARRLARVGRLVRIAGAVTTSARRFAAAGPTRQLLRNAGLMAAFHLGADTGRLHARYGSNRGDTVHTAAGTPAP